MTSLVQAPAMLAPERRRLMGTAYDLAGASSAEEARVLAGLDWEPVHVPLFSPADDTAPSSLEDLDLVVKERGVRHGGNGEFFGVVGREHGFILNGEMFDFADTLLEQADTTWADSSPFGGALADGRQPFLAFNLGEGVQVAGQDAVGLSVLLSNGHVGNKAFVLTVTPLRYRCSNVVRAAIRKGGKNLAHFTIQHSGDLAEKLVQVRSALDLTSAYMREFQTMADALAESEFSLSDFEDFLTELVPASGAGKGAVKTAENRRAIFRQNWSTPTLTDDLRPTRWGALNVVTEVLDHGDLTVRQSHVGAAERRLNSVHFGEGARIRDRAYNLLRGGN